MNRAVAWVCGMLLLGAGALSRPAAADEYPLMLTVVDGVEVAANGHDVVAYFDGKVRRGKPAFQVEHRGANWWFESSEAAAKFERDPEKYEPAYGGFCAYAAAQGQLVSTDPDAWSVINDRLYLNYNTSVRIRWEAKRDKYIEQADRHWARLTN